MGIYRISSVGRGGFKVHVADEAGGLRVIGIFQTEAEARAWIDTDGRDAAPVTDPREGAQAGAQGVDQVDAHKEAERGTRPAGNQSDTDSDMR